MGDTHFSLTVYLGSSVNICVGLLWPFLLFIFKLWPPTTVALFLIPFNSPHPLVTLSPPCTELQGSRVMCRHLMFVLTSTDMGCQPSMSLGAAMPQTLLSFGIFSTRVGLHGCACIPRSYQLVRAGMQAIHEKRGRPAPAPPVCFLCRRLAHFVL